MIVRKLFLAAFFVSLLSATGATAEDSHQDSQQDSWLAGERDTSLTFLQTLSTSFQSLAWDEAVRPCGHAVGCGDAVGCGEKVCCSDAVCCCCDCPCYLGFFGGYENLTDYTGEGVGGGSRQIPFEPDGYLLGLTIGKKYPNNLRIEAELTYREDSTESYSIGNIVNGNFVPVATFAAFGSVHSISTMGNLLYDFNNLPTKLVPYVGVGIGAVFVDGDVVTPALGRTDSFTDDVFAYQVLAGVSREICPRAEFYAEYRYFNTTGVSISSMTAPTSAEFDYESSNVLFGLRFTLP